MATRKLCGSRCTNPRRCFQTGQLRKVRGGGAGGADAASGRSACGGLDYVFGYKDPYVEQRIGVDSYVVPVYANRKESGEDALAVEVEMPPPSVGRVEPHDSNEELVQSNVGTCFPCPYLLSSAFLSQ